MNSNSNSSLHQLMAEIVEKYGEVTLTKQRLMGLLSDLSPQVYCRYQSVLSRAMSDCIPSKLMKIRELDEADFKLKLSNIRKDFQDSNYLIFGVANYIVGCFTYALGLSPEPEICDVDESSAKSGKVNFTEYKDEDYCGNFNQEGLRSGFGITKNTANAFYAGEWKLDMKQGIGLYVDDRRNKYAGEWRINRKNGVGVSSSYDGFRYAGEWKNGKRHGHGIVFFPNGEKMFTKFKEDKIISTEDGIFYLKDGSHICGCMSEFGPDGLCNHFLIDGSVKVEFWDNGKKT